MTAYTFTGQGTQQMSFLELRERAKRSLGDTFSIKEFPNVVLRTGGVPLAVLEGVIDEWIERTRSS